MRCPSEPFHLKLSDIDWDGDRIRVFSTKTEHLRGGGVRYCPIFPELREVLLEAFERAGEGQVYLLSEEMRGRGTGANLRTRFEKILERAGVVPWTRLFHSMRASRQTELAAEWPLHVVCAWLGNSEAVAAKHYLKVRDEDFARASRAECDPRARN